MEQGSNESRLDKHVAQVELLQDLILEDLIKLLQRGEATAADRTAILKFLRENGWSVDPNSLPQELKGILTSAVSFDDEDDDPVVGRIAAG